MRAHRWLLKAPILIYRYSLSALIGRHCRHLPTCSAYSLEAIDRHGAWLGFWLGLSRVTRCRPGGTDGYDPVPETLPVHPRWAPWRAVRWAR